MTACIRTGFAREAQGTGTRNSHARISAERIKADAAAPARYPDAAPMLAQRRRAGGVSLKEAVAAAVAELGLELPTGIEPLPQLERRKTSIRAEALSTVARGLLTGKPVPETPARSRSPA